MTEVTSVNGQTGAVVLTATDVEAVPESVVGQPSGVASLNGSGVLPEAQLPSSVVSSSTEVELGGSLKGKVVKPELAIFTNIKDKGALGNGEPNHDLAIFNGLLEGASKLELFIPEGIYNLDMPVTVGVLSLTEGSATATISSTSAGQFRKGQTIFSVGGSEIPGHTIVKSVSGSTLTLSRPAIATAAARTVHANGTLFLPPNAERINIYGAGLGLSVLRASPRVFRAWDMLRFEDYDAYQHIEINGVTFDANWVVPENACHAFIGSIPGGPENRQNFKDIVCRNIDTINVPTPPTVSASGSNSGGELATGTYWARVAAIFSNGTAIQGFQVEASAAVTGPNGSVTVRWPLVPGALQYQVWIGTSSLGENKSFTVGSEISSFTYTGQTGTAGTMPAPTGYYQSVGIIQKHVAPGETQTEAVDILIEDADFVGPIGVNISGEQTGSSEVTAHINAAAAAGVNEVKVESSAGLIAGAAVWIYNPTALQGVIEQKLIESIPDSEHVKFTMPLQYAVVNGQSLILQPSQCNAWHDRILLRRVFHNPGFVPTCYYPANNYQFGQAGYGDTISCEDCYGLNAGDTNLEADGIQDFTWTGGQLVDGYANKALFRNFRPTLNIGGQINRLVGARLRTVNLERESITSVATEGPKSHDLNVCNEAGSAFAFGEAALFDCTTETLTPWATAKGVPVIFAEGCWRKLRVRNLTIAMPNLELAPAVNASPIFVLANSKMGGAVSDIDGIYYKLSGSRSGSHSIIARLIRTAGVQLGAGQTDYIKNLTLDLSGLVGLTSTLDEFVWVGYGEGFTSTKAGTIDGLAAIAAHGGTAAHYPVWVGAGTYSGLLRIKRLDSGKLSAVSTGTDITTSGTNYSGKVIVGETISGRTIPVERATVTVSNAPTGVVASLASGGSLTSGQQKFYKLVPVDRFGGLGPVSAEVNATPSGSTLSVKVEWTAAANAAGGYRLYRGTATNSEAGYLVVAAGATSYIDTGGTALTGSSNVPEKPTQIIQNLDYVQERYLVKPGGTLIEWSEVKASEPEVVSNFNSLGVASGEASVGPGQWLRFTGTSGGAMPEGLIKIPVL